jgi:hypothetical protein
VPPTCGIASRKGLNAGHGPKGTHGLSNSRPAAGRPVEVGPPVVPPRLALVGARPLRAEGERHDRPGQLAEPPTRSPRRSSCPAGQEQLAVPGFVWLIRLPRREGRCPCVLGTFGTDTWPPRDEQSWPSGKTETCHGRGDHGAALLAIVHASAGVCRPWHAFPSAEIFPIQSDKPVEGECQHA